MKVKLLALCALLSVVPAFAQQKYLLPIGSNVNDREADVSIIISSLDTWARAEDVFYFRPSMGQMEDLIKSRATILVENYAVPVGFEHGEFALNVMVNPGADSQSIFQLQQSGDKWVIPPEVLDVKLNYGLGTGWKLQGAADVKMHIFKNGELVKYYSTKEGVGPDTPCEIGAARSVLSVGIATVNGQFAFPWLKEDWWDESEITIEAFDGWATFYNANGSPRDGELLSVSEPPPAFLESLRAPEMPPQTPVFVVSAARITKIARIGNITEITVSVDTGTVAYIEFTERIGGNWNAVPSYPVPLRLQTGSTKFSHTTEAPASFYRVRIAEANAEPPSQ